MQNYYDTWSDNDWRSLPSLMSATILEI